MGNKITKSSNKSIAEEENAYSSNENFLIKNAVLFGQEVFLI
jgi:hypothetical protein